MSPRFRLTCAPVLAALLLAGCGHEPDAKELFASARSHIAAQDLRGGRAYLIKALHLEPRNRTMLVTLLRIQLRMGDGEASARTLNELAALGVKSPELVRMSAESALYRNQPQVALDTLGQDVSPEAWRIRAAAHGLLGDAGQAKADFASGFAAGGNYRLAVDHADFLLADEDLAGAAQQIAAIVQAQPNALEALLLQGQLAAKQGRTADAIAAYARAAKIYPSRAEPLVAEADLLDGQGKVDAAFKLVKRAAELDPGNTRIADLQIQLGAEKGDWENVRKLLQPREGTLDPNSGNGLKYAEALLRLGHPEQARAMFSSAVLVSPQNRFARIMLGEAQLATGDAVSAWATLKPLTDGAVVVPQELQLAERAARAAKDPAADRLRERLQSPELAQIVALSNAGQGAIFRKDWAGAIAAYTQLPGLENDSEALRRVALSCVNLGRYDEAVAYADKALALQPYDADLLYMAGHARLMARHDLPTAVRMLTQAVENDGDNKLFKSELAKAKAAAG